MGHRSLASGVFCFFAMAMLSTSVQSIIIYILGEVKGGLLSRGRRGETAAACCHVGTDSESRREISNALVSPRLLDFFF